MPENDWSGVVTDEDGLSVSFEGDPFAWDTDAGRPGSITHLPKRQGERKRSTVQDVATGEGWDRLGGWRPIFDPERFAEAIDSYKP